MLSINNYSLGISQLLIRFKHEYSDLGFITNRIKPR
jgi:hypothetical protein